MRPDIREMTYTDYMSQKKKKEKEDSPAFKIESMHRYEHNMKKKKRKTNYSN